MIGAWYTVADGRIISYQCTLEVNERESIERIDRIERGLKAGKLLHIRDRWLPKLVIGESVTGALKTERVAKKKSWDDSMKNGAKASGFSGNCRVAILESGC